MAGVPTPDAPPANPPTSTAYATATTPAAPIPTPAVQTCATPGMYPPATLPGGSVPRLDTDMCTKALIPSRPRP